MIDNWTTDKDSATQVFLQVVWPAWIKNGVEMRLILLENREDEIAKTLDRECGIDALLDNGRGKIPIALRTQQDAHNWRTFTIRKIRDSGAYTELEKLNYALENDTLRPYLVIQSYLQGTKLLGSAIGKIEHIIQYILNNPDCPTNRTTNASFYYVSWDSIECKELNIQSKQLLDDAMFSGLPKLPQEEEVF